MVTIYVTRSGYFCSPSYHYYGTRKEKALAIARQRGHDPTTHVRAFTVEKLMPWHITSMSHLREENLTAEQKQEAREFLAEEPTIGM